MNANSSPSSDGSQVTQAREPLANRIVTSLDFAIESRRHEMGIIALRETDNGLNEIFKIVNVPIRWKNC